MDCRKRPGKAIKKPDWNQSMDIREIVREHVLRFLPAKALYRCKTVCRDWNLQITAPCFVHNQSNSFRSVSGVFYQVPSSQPSFIPLHPMAYGVPDPQLSFLPEPVMIKSSSNGLLCCQGYTEEKPYYICNPVNQQYKKLPKPSKDHGKDVAVVLIFEPSPLDFIPSFKLICGFPSADLDDACEFEMYSSSQDSWKMFREIFFGKIPQSGVHVNGVIYWRTLPRGLLAFDMAIDRCRIISSYETVEALGLVNGKLCSAIGMPGSNSISIGIRVLSDTFANTAQMGFGGDIWELIEKVKVGITRDAALVQVLCVEGDLVLFVEKTMQVQVTFVEGDVLLFGGETTILSHNLKTKEQTDLSSEAEFDTRQVYVPYVNSLVAL